MANNNNRKNPNVPNLRFPEFQGEWEEKKLGGVCRMQAGKFINASEIFDKQNDNLFPCYGGNGLRGYAESFNHNGIYPLIGRQGALCGNVTLAKGKFYATEHAIVVKPEKNNDTICMFYLLSSLNLNQYATGQAQPGLSVQNLEKIEILLPEVKAEQIKIGTFLSLIDERIKTQIKIIEDLKLLKSTLSKRLLLNESWEQFQIADIASLGRGRVISSVEISKQRNPKYPVYSSQTSNNGIMGYLDTYDFNGEYVTWTTDGANAGTVFYRNGKFNCTNVCGTLKINSSHNPYFVVLCLNLIARKYVFTNLANPKLMNNVMASIKVSLPELREQNRLAKLFASLTNKIQCEISILEAFCEKKKYFLQKMFI